MNKKVLEDIAVERDAQDDQWGGPAHDDTHHYANWWEFICKQMEKSALEMLARGDPYCTTPDARQRLVKAAAIAIAAIESFDRKAATTQAKE